MSYGEKYRLRAETAKWKDDIVILIKKKDYAGSLTDKYIGAGGITLTKDKDDKICGTSLTFSIQSDINFEYIDFADAETREYLVELYKNNTLIWQGYLIADNYREDFRDPPYDVQLTATDGLGLLKNYDYTPVTTVSDKINRVEMLFNILENTGLSLKIDIAYDLIPIFQYVLWEGETVPLIDGTKNLFSSVEFYDDYFSGWNCYDVMAQILPPDCTVTQHLNQWLIRRNEQDSEILHRLFTDGTPWTETTGAGETVLNLAAIGSGDVYPIGMAEMQMDYAWKSFTLNSELGKRPSFLLNYNFADGLTSWNQSSTGFTDTYITDGIVHVGLEGDGGAVSDNVNQSVQNWVNEDDFCLELKYALRASRRNVTHGTFSAIEGEVNFRVSILNGEDIYFLDKANGWTTGTSYITETIMSNAANMEWHDLKVYADSPPVSGTMTFEVFRFHTDLTNVSAILLGVTNVVMRTLGGDSYLETQQYEDIPVRTNGVNVEEVTIIPTDVPDVDNFDRIFYNAQTTSTGVRLADYSNKSMYSLSFSNVIINSLIFLHGINRQIVSGTFRGQNLHLNALVKAASADNRKYTVQSGSWDILNDRFNLDLIEIPGSADSSAHVLKYSTWDDYVDWIDEAKQTEERSTVSNSGNRGGNVTSSVGLQGTQGIQGIGNQGIQGPAGMTWVTAPETATSAGTEGNVAKDANYFYICTATNVWTRVPISTEW